MLTGGLNAERWHQPANENSGSTQAQKIVCTTVREKTIEFRTSKLIYSTVLECEGQRKSKDEMYTCIHSFKKFILRGGP
jgi:hypothetical protein